MDKGAVAVIKKRKVVKHLMNGKSGKLAESVFFSGELIQPTQKN